MGQKLRDLKNLLWILLLLIVFGSAGWLLHSCSTSFTTQTEITADQLRQQIQDVRSLITEEYHYTNMGKFENSATYNGWTIPLTQKSFILAYDGTIHAGVDLDKMDIQVNAGSILIRLPKAEILSHEILEESIVIYDESNNLFNPIKISDYTAFSRSQKEVMEQKAINNGLLESAQLRARDVLYDLFILNKDIQKMELKFELAK